ncbi:MAG: hypothetical protein Q8O16_03860, partial [Dehalococcoidia bacterium]|nr:hypothetical protein [Dehalococcoidia bacterium]
MALSLIIVLGAFVWLLYETRWLTVRLAAGAAPSLTHRHIPFREALPKPPGLRTARAQVLSGGMKAAIVFLIAVTAAEVVTNFTNIFWGIISHSVILIALIAYSTVKAGSPDHKLFLTLCLAPLTRIVSLAMPLTRFPVIFWYIIIYPTLMVGAWVTMRRVNYTPYEVGLNARNLKLQWLISLSGILLGVMEYV